jgi:hypothetical protein
MLEYILKNNILFQFVIIAVLILACIFGIIVIKKNKKILPGGGLPTQQIQEIFDPGVKNVIVIQHKDENNEQNSGKDRDAEKEKERV